MPPSPPLPPLVPPCCHHIPQPPLPTEFCMFLLVLTNIYIYIYRERERERGFWCNQTLQNYFQGLDQTKKKKTPCSLKIFAIDDIFLGKFFYQNKKGSKYLKHEKENKKIKCNTYHKKKTKTTK